jgi:signal transduction histidine kinase
MRSFVLFPRVARVLVDLVLVMAAFTVDWYVWLRFEAGDPTAWWSAYLLHIGVLATLLLRWRRPVLVLLVQVGYALLLTWMLPHADFVGGLLIGLHTVARLRTPRVSVPAAVSCIALICLNGYRSVWDSFYYAGNSVIDIGLAAALYAIPAAVVWLLGYWSRRAAQARAATEAVERTRRTERLQLARELHDIVSHSVTVMMLQAAGARAVAGHEPERVVQALDAIQAAGTQSMAELRRMLELMRMTAGAEPAGTDTHLPGLDQLDDLANRMRATGLSLTVSSTGTPVPLDASVDLTAYRVVQEALTNSTKYAGPDATVQVQFGWTAEHLTVTVTDHVAGRPPRKRGIVPSTGHGLIGLQERVHAVGGTFRTEARPDGFLVAATLPTASH